MSGRSLWLGLIVMAAAATLTAAPLAVYDTYDDWEGDGVQPDGLWRFQYGHESDGSGPYTDMPVWSAGNYYFTDPSVSWGSGQIGQDWSHPGWAGAEDNDVMHTFQPETSGKYLLIGNARHDRLDSGGTDGIELTIRQGQAAGDDTTLFSAWPIRRNPDNKRYGIGGFAIADLAPADTFSGNNEIYFRVSAGPASNSGTDGELLRHRVYRLPEVGPQAIYWSSAGDFATNLPVADPAGTGFGQLGDVDTAGNPVWFYQTGRPGSANPNDYHLISEYADGVWTGTPDGLPLGNADDWAMHADSWLHPGRDNDHAAIRTWLALFDGIIDITYSASDRDPGGGDGVIARVYRNADLLAGSELIIPNGGTGGVVSLTNINIQYGDQIHFAILPGASNWWDGTNFSAEIYSLTPIIPEPTSIALLAGGLAALVARRRRR